MFRSEIAFDVDGSVTERRRPPPLNRLYPPLEGLMEEGFEIISRLNGNKNERTTSWIRVSKGSIEFLGRF